MSPGNHWGEIFAEKVNINIEMINAGLAEVYRGIPAQNLKITTYQDAERTAKKSVKGIWELRDGNCIKISEKKKIGEKLTHGKGSGSSDFGF
jgi:endonuclease YncB( thermonuclease family)